ncbi:glycoside hydrolase family 5 protein [Sarocladium implicatum]|nr:glycoside hydrolase family 5 protein [Sarocladium implicatum]
MASPHHFLEDILTAIAPFSVRKCCMAVSFPHARARKPELIKLHDDRIAGKDHSPHFYRQFIAGPARSSIVGQTGGSFTLIPVPKGETCDRHALHPALYDTMKGFITAVIAAFAGSLAFAAASALPDKRQSSPSWAGTNLYFLQGLSDQDQDAYIQQLSNYNVKVVRLWVNSQSQGCQKGSRIVRDIPALETTIGQYNKVTLDELDKVLVKLVSKNIKAIISPHDSNSLIGDYRQYVLG